jgi:hypothetical protein
MRENGASSSSSDLSAAPEKRAPSAKAADASSSTHIGRTKSSGKRCESIGTVKSDAPNAEMPKITYAAATTAAAMRNV